MGLLQVPQQVSLVVSGIWNNFVKLGMPIIALTLLAVTGKANGSKMIAAFVGVGASSQPSSSSASSCAGS